MKQPWLRSRCGGVILALALLSAPIASATDLPTFGADGGEGFRALCPRGSYLAGFFGQTGAWIDTLSLWCAEWSLLANDLSKAEAQRRPVVGQSQGGEPNNAKCPEAHLIRGARISALSSEPNLVHGIEFECTWYKDLQPTQLRYRFGGIDELGGWSFRPVSNWDFCPENEVAVGVYGSSGLFIHRIGLVCDGTPTELRRRAFAIFAALTFMVAAGGLIAWRRLKRR